MSRPNPNIRCVSHPMRGHEGQWIDISKGPASQYLEADMTTTDLAATQRAMELENKVIVNLQIGMRDLQVLKELGECYVRANIRIGRQPDDPCRTSTITGEELARLFFHSCARTTPRKPH